MKKLFSVVRFILVVVLITAGCSSDSSNSCGKVSNAGFNVSPTGIYVYFEGNQNSNSYLIEYGPTGFIKGTGTTRTTSQTSLDIIGLTPSTTYDIYITSICSADDQSNAYKLSSITTDASQCNGTVSLSLTQFYSPSNIDLSISYSDSNPESYDIEYGLQGFTLGSGTKISTSYLDTSFSVTNIQPLTNYDFYIRAVCYGNDPSPYRKFQYTTIESCPKPGNLDSYVISGSCNSGTQTRAFTWSYLSGNPTSFTVSLVTNSNINSPDTGNTTVTSNNGIAFSGLFCLWKAFYVKANCTDNSSSDWAGPFYFN
jgi:hypothetical protein